MVHTGNMTGVVQRQIREEQSQKVSFNKDLVRAENALTG